MCHGPLPVHMAPISRLTASFHWMIGQLSRTGRIVRDRRAAGPGDGTDGVWARRTLLSEHQTCGNDPRRTARGAGRRAERRTEARRSDETNRFGHGPDAPRGDLSEACVRWRSYRLTAAPPAGGPCLRHGPRTGRVSPSSLTSRSALCDRSGPGRWLSCLNSREPGPASPHPAAKARKAFAPPLRRDGQECGTAASYGYEMTLTWKE